MKYRSFGKLGWNVSETSLGGWALGGGAWGHQSDDDSIAALRRAVDLGVNLIDTAAGYGNGRSEQVIAKALADVKTKVFIVTKTPPAAGHWPPLPSEGVDNAYPESHLRRNLEERLRNLNTDCIDVLLLHIWSRSWNRDPKPLRVLEKFKQEGKIRAFGLSTPDHDQDQVNTLLAGGQIDVLQLVYNLFEQQPAAETLPLALENGVATMGRLVFDEGSLTGKLTVETRFPEGDFRARYFGGDRLARTVARVEKLRADLTDSGYTLPQAAIRFALANPAMCTVIPGMRNPAQVEANTAASDQPNMSNELLEKLYQHNWNRGNWHAGK
ncbi:MAG TPA: aldo/keto reductase [Roseimicrobium sp.]|nr:aldo/keto reductase [Roseimicrobium sp.]